MRITLFARVFFALFLFLENEKNIMRELKSTLLYNWFNNVWNHNDESAIDRMMASGSTARGIVPDEHPKGAEGFKIFYNGFKSRFSDINITVEQVVSEGDFETTRLSVKATETATGKPVAFAGMCMVKISGGKISEAWNNFDFLDMHEQLGMKLMAGE